MLVGCQAAGLDAAPAIRSLARTPAYVGEGLRIIYMAVPLCCSLHGLGSARKYQPVVDRLQKRFSRAVVGPRRQ